MAFSQDAIGFFLQMEDQMSPKLERAASNYEKFVRSLEKSNKRAFNVASKGMDAMAETVEAIGQLPDRVAREYDRAMQKLSRKISPIVQPITFEADQKGLRKAVRGAISDLLRQAQVRLSAAVPLARNPIFASGSMRGSYSNRIQPPDMKGGFQNIPRYAEGGIVDGPPGAVDKIMGFLTPGELVLPPEVSQRVQDLGVGELPASLEETYRHIQNIGRALPQIKRSAELGLDPEAPKLYQEGIRQVEAGVQELHDASRNMSQQQQQNFNPMLRESMELLEGTTENAENMKEAFTEATTTVRFAAMTEVVGDLANGMQGLLSQSKSLMQTAEGNESQTFIENMNELRQVLPREEVNALKEELVAIAHQFGVGTAAMGDAVSALAEVGFRREGIRALAGVVGQATIASTASAQSFAELAKSMDTTTSLARDQQKAIFATIEAYEALGPASAENLVQGVQQDLEQAASLTQQFSAQQQERLAKSLVNIRASVESVAKGQGEVIGQLMGQSLAAGTEGEAAARQLGFTQDALARALSRGDVESVLSRIRDRLIRGGDRRGMQKVAEIYGISTDDAANLAQKLGQALDKTREFQGANVGAAEAVKSLAEAERNATTRGQDLSQILSRVVARTELFGVSGLDVLNTVNEVNPALLTLAGKMFTVSFWTEVSATATKVWSLVTRRAAISEGIMTAATKVWTVVAGIATGATTALGVAFNILFSPITAIVIAVGAAITAVVILQRKFNILGKLVQGLSFLWDKFTNLISNVAGMLAGPLKTGLDLITAPMRLTFQLVKGISGFLLSKLMPAVKAVWNVIKGPINAVRELISAGGAIVGRVLGSLFGGGGGGGGGTASPQTAQPTTQSAGALPTTNEINSTVAGQTATSDEPVRQEITRVAEKMDTIIGTLKQNGITPQESRAQSHPRSPSAETRNVARGGN